MHVSACICICLHIIDADIGWDGTDEAHKFLVGVHPHSAVPLGQPTWRSESPGTTQVTDTKRWVGTKQYKTQFRNAKCQRPVTARFIVVLWHNSLLDLSHYWWNWSWIFNLPEQKLGGVVKAEHVVIILNVVLIQKGVELLQLNHKGSQEQHGQHRQCCWTQWSELSNSLGLQC